MSLTYPTLLARETIYDLHNKMKELIRESALGQLLRLATGQRIFRYPEERPGFEIPYERLMRKEKLAEINKEINIDSETHTPGIEEVEDQEMARHDTVEDHGPDYDVEHQIYRQISNTAIYS